MNPIGIGFGSFKTRKARCESIVIYKWCFCTFITWPVVGYLWLYKRFAKSHRVIRFMILKIPDRHSCGGFLSSYKSEKDYLCKRKLLGKSLYRALFTIRWLLPHQKHLYFVFQYFVYILVFFQNIMWVYGGY